jgi:outer membrane receptor protein involved in Fe transport
MRLGQQSGLNPASRRLRLVGASAAVLSIAVMGAGSAWAQQSSSTNPSTSSGGSSSGVQEVVVTGSRIVRSTFNTPNPVTVIGEQEIQKLNLTNAGDIVAELPQNSNFFAGNNVGLGNFNVGAQLVNLRGLNPYFGTRTLTLIDGDRVVPTTAGGGVDVTLIPSMLIGRVETETGGASAIYGSDAIAGVVNIILDTKLEGFKGQVDYGETKYGDGEDYHASAAYGHGFANGRGHFIIGGEWEHSESIGICSQVRSWCATNEAVFTNPDYNTPGSPGYGQPHYVLGAGGTTANTSATGVLFPVTPFAPFVPTLLIAPVGQMQFNSSGSALVPYTAGSYAAGAFPFGYQEGGDGVGAYDETTMKPDVRKYTALLHADYDITDNIQGFVEGWFARSVAVNPVANGALGPTPLQVADSPNLYVGTPGGPASPSATPLIAGYNAYLTPAEAAYVNSLGGLAGFGSDVLDDIEAQNRTNNDTWRLTGGLKGDLGGSWGWDAHAEYGDTITQQRLIGNVVSPFLSYALDAVKNGAGQTVCGVNIPGQINPLTGSAYTAADVALAAENGGCQPLDLFGTGNASQAALNYAFPTLYEDVVYTQTDLAANIHGDVFQGWGAGAIKFAGGAEYRHEYGDVTHNLINQPWYDEYELSYGLDYRGTIDVLEGYGELNVPLLKDVPLVHYAELDGAIRETYNAAHNDTTEPADFSAETPAQAGQSASHDFPTWKVSAIWDVTDWLRFRGTRSRDVRAPQFRELFQSYAAAAAGPFASVDNPWHNLVPQETNISTGGTLALEPEVADTWTGGIVLSPKEGWFNRVRLSADWYQITINNPIVGPPFGIGAQNIVNGCFTGSSFFCSLITRDANNDILSVNNSAANLGQYITRGVDFEGDYDLPLETVSKSLPGDLNFRILASYLYDMIIDTGEGGPTINYAGQTGPTAAFGGYNTSPKWQANAFLTYSNGPFSGTVQVHYIGAGVLEASVLNTVTGFYQAPLTPGMAGYSTTSPVSINDNHVPSAWYVNLAGSYDITHNLTFFSNINNLFNKAPPIAPGGNGYPTNPVYFDTYGMSFKVGLRARF